jgi:glucose/arabinose dehydrogenase
MRLLPLVTALCWCISLPAVITAQDYPAATFQLPPEVDLNLQPVDVIIPAPFSHLPDRLSLNLPPGFTATVFASFEDMRRPRFMAFDDEGVLHVSNMDDKQILALPDRDGDGVADESIVVAEDFSRAHSLAFHNGDMYVADRGSIVLFRDGDDDGLYEERSDLVRNIPSSGSHSTRTIVFDEQNEKIYLSVGWPCDLCRTSESDRGTILEFNLDGSGRRVFASGVRNVIGMALHPLTNQLWGTNNGHDLEGIIDPPEWIDIIRDGSFHGQPFATGYQVYADFELPEYRSILPLSDAEVQLVQSIERPVALVPAHTAPMGIDFYTHDQFPELYRNAAFVALHAGHAKLAPVPGYKVIALFTEADGSNARVADFITGFQTGTELADVWGYPMGVITDADGSLYVSSDLGHTMILRIDHSPIVATWERNLPEKVVTGSNISIDATVHISREATDAGAPTLVADLSALGGPVDAPLQPLADNSYALTATFAVEVPRGLKTVAIDIRQEAEPTPYAVLLTSTVAVLPRSTVPDQIVFDDELSPGWSVGSKTWLEDYSLDLEQTEVVMSGSRAAAFPVQEGLWDWVVRFRPQPAFDPLGYEGIRFAFHPGEVVKPHAASFSIYLSGTLVDLLAEGLIDLDERRWQVVELPLAAFGAGRSEIIEVSFAGNFGGTFYIDDLRFRGPSPATAIEDDGSTPTDFALAQNYPNPFNSDTIIRFSLPFDTGTRLTIYNLAGQTVRRLVDGPASAGAQVITWDGTDSRGRQVATGVYAYRLETQDRQQTRKLLLLR